MWRVLTTFPSSASFGHPLSSARCSREGDTSHQQRTDRDPLSNNAPRRVPPFRRSGCLSPSRHTKEKCFAERLLPPAFVPTLSPTPLTLCPQAGDSVFEEHCECHSAVTRSICDCSKVQTPFLLFGTSAPGPDDPSTPTSSTGSAVDENRLSRSY